METFFSMEVELTWKWDYEMEPWKDSCFSRREASAELGNLRTEDTGHVSKLDVKTLFIFENFHS